MRRNGPGSSQPSCSESVRNRDTERPQPRCQSDRLQARGESLPWMKARASRSTGFSPRIDIDGSTGAHAGQDDHGLDDSQPIAEVQLPMHGLNDRAQ